DIHIEPSDGRLRVRCRIDGMLFNQQPPPAQLHAAIISRLKIMANMDIAVQHDERAENCMNAMNLNRHRMIEYELWPLYVKNFTEKWEAWKAESNYMDFTDLIIHGYKNMESAPGIPEVLIVDECQDMSKLEIELIHKWGKTCDILLEAGDPDQAIYTWRGANPNIFIENKIPENNKKYLRQSYRLPEAVHEYIRKWIRIIKAREDVEFKPRNASGSVKRMDASYLEPDPLIDICKEQMADGKTTMILASCGYMLVQIIARLKGEGLPFYNPFSTKNARWNPLQRIRKRVMPVDRVAAFMAPHESNDEFQREWNRQDFKNWMGLLEAKRIFKRGTKSYVASE
ncbi:hypothetical protein LCGC14_3118980, partial [marine sediment metagenome]